MTAIRYFALVLCVFSVLQITLYATPNNHQTITAYNGKIAIITTKQSPPNPLVLRDKKLEWIHHPTRKGTQFAIIPISYHTPPSTITLSPHLTLHIKEAPYKQESIVVTNTKTIRPDPAIQKRINKERTQALAIYDKTSPKRHWSEKFIYPVKSPTITSPYGTKRVFNNEVKSFHGGVDFRAPTGTPIYATNSGIVVLVADRFLSGKSIIIDHGNGIYSTYFHNSKLLVQTGKRVRKGEKIALSGASGRVSGAHLHFGIVCNGVQVDPIDFIRQVNELL